MYPSGLFPSLLPGLPKSPPSLLPQELEPVWGRLGWGKSGDLPSPFGKEPVLPVYRFSISTGTAESADSIPNTRQ